MPIWPVTHWKPLAVAGLVVAAIIAWEWHGATQWNAGVEHERARIEKQQAAIGRGMQVEKDRADAKHRGAVLARQASEQKIQALETELVAANTRIDGLLREHRDHTKPAEAVSGSDAAGPDWIGVFGECLARAERLSRRLGQVGKDAAGWADQVNGLQGYVRALDTRPY